MASQTVEQPTGRHEPARVSDGDGVKHVKSDKWGDMEVDDDMSQAKAGGKRVSAGTGSTSDKGVSSGSEHAGGRVYPGHMRGAAEYAAALGANVDVGDLARRGAGWSIGP